MPNVNLVSVRSQSDIRPGSLYISQEGNLHRVIDVHIRIGGGIKCDMESPTGVYWPAVVDVEWNGTRDLLGFYNQGE